MNPTITDIMSQKPTYTFADAPIRSLRHRFAVMAAFLSLVASAPAQLKTDFAAVSFDDDLDEFVYLSLPELGEAMVENTSLTIFSSRAEFVVLVAGVVDARTGEILYGSMSQPILANRGKARLIEIGGGPIGGPWDAFEDPLFGFEDSVEALDAVWGTSGVGFAPTASPSFIWGTNGTAAGDPEGVLEAIWGVGGASYEDGTKLLILTSVSLDPESELPHSAAILPFRSFSD